MSSWRLLLDRELHSQTAVPFTTFAFSSKRIKEFSRYDCNVEHAGCVNTATWSRDGNLLITGSDDRLVKIWRASGSFDCLKELYSCNTRHRGNIFCADFAPDSPNTIYSCAADGQLRCTKLDDGQGGRELYQSQDIM